MVEAFNAEQARRQAAREPAIGMEFIPSIHAEVSGYPTWHTELMGTYWNLLGLGVIG
jgi:hypothetical protein